MRPLNDLYKGVLSRSVPELKRSVLCPQKLAKGPDPEPVKSVHTITPPPSAEDLHIHSPYTLMAWDRKSWWSGSRLSRLRFSLFFLSPSRRIPE
jgi:hypothetical protein